MSILSQNFNDFYSIAIEPAAWYTGTREKFKQQKGIQP